MNSPDTGIQRPQKVEQKQPEGKSSKPKMEEHGPSSRASEDSLQDTSGQTDTCGKVSLGFVQYYCSISCKCQLFNNPLTLILKHAVAVLVGP